MDSARESLVLSGFINVIDALEVLRLTRYPWPRRALEGKRHDRLKRLILEKDKEHSRFIPYNGDPDVGRWMALRHGAFPDAAALELVKVNECELYVQTRTQLRYLGGANKGMCLRITTVCKNDGIDRGDISLGFPEKYLEYTK